MTSEKEMRALVERISQLRINPDALEEIRIHTAAGVQAIPNIHTTQNSLAIYASIVSNDGYIIPDAARRGLALFGRELEAETREKPERHPNIELLLQIAEQEKVVRTDVIRRNATKPIPPHITSAIERLRETNHTPFYVYDKTGIEDTIDEFNATFAWVPGGFKNYFAVKALPNPHIVRIMKEHGWGADCSSLPELRLARDAGIMQEDIMFTSNDTPVQEFQEAHNIGAIINLDDITHIERVQEALGGKFPNSICFRYNPGQLRSGNEIIGKPEEAKYGVPIDQIEEAYKKAKALGARNFGLHTMVVSNMLDEHYLIETARMVFELGAKLSKYVGINFSFFNLGGGIGTPYKPEQRPVDLAKVSEGVKQAYKEAGFTEASGPRVVMECGRAITGPHGYLATEVLHVTRKYREFVGVDACMANLMRPGMYGAYHHITVLEKEDAPLTHTYNVTGSLCENNDQFAINRPLPEIQRGDVLVIHNGGAHGHAMGFQYNGKLRCAEFLADARGITRKIRRAETLADYFATVEF